MNNYDFANILKKQTNKNTKQNKQTNKNAMDIFSHISVQSFEQKRIIF